jgi:hypothetical protein
MDNWADSLNEVPEWASMNAWRNHKNPMAEGCAHMQMVTGKLIELANTFSIEAHNDTLQECSFTPMHY